MATTYYAWTNIRGGTAKEPKTVEVGSKVTASDLGISDNEFQELIDIGAVRTYEYPDMGKFPGSPVELRKAQLAAASAGGVFDTQYGRVAVEDVDEKELKKVEVGKK